mmetsp:Transcript_1390/g.4036  ORF Transcript_1390/g.4036 Transcript_1390/m.4036 type:complete len:210 (-) Transcript_1390:218-847(-)
MPRFLRYKRYPPRAKARTTTMRQATTMPTLAPVDEPAWEETNGLGPTPKVALTIRDSSDLALGTMYLWDWLYTSLPSSSDQDHQLYTSPFFFWLPGESSSTVCFCHMTRVTGVWICSPLAMTYRPAGSLSKRTSTWEGCISMVLVDVRPSFSSVAVNTTSMKPVSDSVKLSGSGISKYKSRPFSLAILREVISPPSMPLLYRRIDHDRA